MPILSLDIIGESALHKAASYCKFSLYPYLMELGLDSSLMNEDGDTAIDLLFPILDEEDEEESDPYVKHLATLILQNFEECSEERLFK